MGCSHCFSIDSPLTTSDIGVQSVLETETAFEDRSWLVQSRHLQCVNDTARADIGGRHDLSPLLLKLGLLPKSWNWLAWGAGCPTIALRVWSCRVHVSLSSPLLPQTVRMNCLLPFDLHFLLKCPSVVSFSSSLQRTDLVYWLSSIGRCWCKPKMPSNNIKLLLVTLSLFLQIGQAPFRLLNFFLLVLFRQFV